MSSVGRNYTNGFDAGTPEQVYIGGSDTARSDPKYGGAMRTVAEAGGRRLLCNDMMGSYWDERPVHGRWGVPASDDASAIAAWRARRW